MTPILESISNHLHSAFSAYRDLAEALPADAFARSLEIPSNTVGSQFWCVVGARESYATALRAGEWSGFTCSLPADETSNRTSIIGALERSAAAVDEGIGIDYWTAARQDLLLALLEHEAQHQGQLIRYVYGLGLDFPASWKDRWSL